MTQSNILKIDAIDEHSPYVDYTDGDVVIIDNVRQLTELSPLCPNYNFVILCCQGRLQLDINGRRLVMQQGEVLFSSPNVILDNFMFSPDFECKVLCLTDRIIQGLLREGADTWNRAVYVQRMNLVALTEAAVSRFAHFYALIRQVMQAPDHRFGKEMMQTLIKSLLLDLCAMLDVSLSQPPAEKPTQGKLLFDRFLNMLSAEEVKRRPVGYYANALAVTPKYLTMVCEHYGGKAASDWINQYVIEDIRYALRNTDSPMKEIADRLGFSNISHFGTYVRRHFGISPTSYRVASRSTS